MIRTRRVLACAVGVSALSLSAHATLVTFTGGTVTRLDSSTQTTNNSVVWDNVDYYEEGGFRLDFLPNTAMGFSALIGDYYGGSNDVIHNHWDLGGLGGVVTVEITKVGGGTFDLNYFTLTSNTAIGGGTATGAERTYVQGWAGGLPTGAAVLLPSENWGFPATVIGLGPEYNAVDRVTFFATTDVDCFGMDDFFIDEIPAPSSLAMIGLGGVVLGVRRRRA